MGALYTLFSANIIGFNAFYFNTGLQQLRVADWSTISDNYYYNITISVYYKQLNNPTADFVIQQKSLFLLVGDVGVMRILSLNFLYRSSSTA